MWASSLNNMLWIVWGLELIQQHSSNQPQMSAGSRCWIRWIWSGYIPSVCNVRQTLTVEVSTSGLNSRANSESEMSYCIRTHGSDLQRLLSLEQLKWAAHFTCDGVNHTRNSHVWDRDNPHGTVESNYQNLFSVNVWCGVIGDQLIGPYIIPQHLTGEIYANSLQDELPALLQKVPLQTRQMYYQHDGVPPHFSQVIRQYLNHKFPNQWIRCGGA